MKNPKQAPQCLRRTTIHTPSLVQLQEYPTFQSDFLCGDEPDHFPLVSGLELRILAIVCENQNRLDALPLLLRIGRLPGSPKW